MEKSIISEFAKLDSHIRKQNLFNGHILVAKKDNIWYSSSFGYASIRDKLPINEDCIFELASITKTFTAYATLLLCKEYNVSLDTDISTYFESFPYKGVCIEHLLRHTSGLPDYMELFIKKWDPTRIAKNKDVLKMLSTSKPTINFASGTNWEYSNTGYVLLAMILEKISGLTFNEVLQKTIFQPLGMQHSAVYNRRVYDAKISNYAYGYIKNPTSDSIELPDNIPGYELVYFLDGIYGDGAISSSAIDLLKWNNAVLKNELPEDVLEMMFTQSKLKDDRIIPYGIGWFLDTDSDLGNIAHHSGGWPGYMNNNVVYLEQDISIIILCNQPNDIEQVQKIQDAIEHITFQRNYSFP